MMVECLRLTRTVAVQYWRQKCPSLALPGIERMSPGNRLFVTARTLGSKTGLDTAFQEPVNPGVSPLGTKVVLTYKMPRGAEDPNFGWTEQQGGYQARFRARVKNSGRICGHDSDTVPGNVREKFGPASEEVVEGYYKVTMTSGGQDLSPYF